MKYNHLDWAEHMKGVVSSLAQYRQEADVGMPDLQIVIVTKMCDIYLTLTAVLSQNSKVSSSRKRKVCR